MLETVAWMLTGLSVIGVVLNARQRIEGFYFWIVANLGWIVVDLIKGIPAQAALFLFYFGTCFYGIYVWRKKKNEQ